MNMRNALPLSAIAMMLAGGITLTAQTTTGALRGQVTDDAGKPIAEARISLESPALFQTRVFTTDANGEYRALLLPVGNYTIKVSAPGKLGKTATNVRVGVGSNLSFPFTLKSTAVA
ncbi:MAG: carboxypeptidase-like regulatory domain-containing protein, partial [Holophaga sp.]